MKNIPIDSTVVDLYNREKHIKVEGIFFVYDQNTGKEEQCFKVRDGDNEYQRFHYEIELWIKPNGCKLEDCECNGV